MLTSAQEGFRSYVMSMVANACTVYLFSASSNFYSAKFFSVPKRNVGNGKGSGMAFD